MYPLKKFKTKNHLAFCFLNDDAAFKTRKIHNFRQRRKTDLLCHGAKMKNAQVRTSHKSTKLVSELHRWLVRSQLSGWFLPFLLITQLTGGRTGAGGGGALSFFFLLEECVKSVGRFQS